MRHDDKKEEKRNREIEPQYRPLTNYPPFLLSFCSLLDFLLCGRRTRFLDSIYYHKYNIIFELFVTSFNKNK